MSKLTNLMLGFILFSMIIVGAKYGADGFKENYDIESGSNWDSQFNYIENMTGIANEMSDILEDPNSNWLEQGIKLGYSVLKTVLKLPAYAKDLVSNVADILNLPPWSVGYIDVILVIVIVFILTSALIRWYL